MTQHDLEETRTERGQQVFDEVYARFTELKDYLEDTLPENREKMLTFVYLDKALNRVSNLTQEIP